MAKKQYLIALNQDQLIFLAQDLEDALASEAYSVSEKLLLAAVVSKLRRQKARLQDV
jgi:hypothetical protein